ncbi:MAG: phosphoribosylformylglycinamidine cyclo-ligase [Gemmatimonadota bacterium]|nr:MAG: phosphoribosylformylglycinamidine cyclo-ligase [Gemmatimonadota bacterium]
MDKAREARASDAGGSPLVRSGGARQIAKRSSPRLKSNADRLRGNVNRKDLDYRAAGVDNIAEADALRALTSRVRRSFSFAGEPGQVGAVHLDLGYFANVVEIAQGVGLAVSTDGVGTKLLVAELMGKYDTIGIDCVAMNVNDILCVGARPLTMLDYIAVERLDAEVLAAVADGLLHGAEEARISIAGGELAQVREMVRGARPGSGFDIVGTAIGLVNLDRIILGDGLRDGDIVIGLDSSGIHSNGLTLARKALLEQGGFRLDQHVEELGRSLGAELLEPTRIYVRPVLALLKAVKQVKALAHITGDGLLNLLRGPSPVGFEIDQPPDPPEIFRLIQRAGNVDDGEMYRVFNMGVGFVIVVSPEEAGEALRTLQGAGAPDARVIGRVTDRQPGRVQLRVPGLVGTREDGFVRAT